MRVLLAALWASTCFGASSASEKPAKLWHESDMPHFNIYYERALPAGFDLQLEQLHSRMRLELAGLAPWMDKEKIDVFFFASSATYQAGPFHPPPWSNGLSLPDKRDVVVYQRADTEGLRRVIAHEMTHVLFESFFRDVGKSAPVWLTEGLAMTQETPQTWGDTEERNSPWHQRLVAGGSIRVLPMKQFFITVPEKDLPDSNEVTDWYLQAYAVTRFLRRQYSRIQFKLLCTKLRDGVALEPALWSVYRFRSFADFQQRYVDWMRNGTKSGDQFGTIPIAPTRIKFP